MLRHALGLALALPVLLHAADAASAEWPQWRGPRGDGHATERGLPVRWSAETVAWKVPLKGQGQSSPCVWGERIFLTSALEDGRKRLVMCLDRADGSLLWEHVAWTGEPEPSHRMNGWASSTCCTDGERVYAFFGRGGGLFCYTVDGELVWKKDLGSFEGPWGTAACPILVDDMVIQNCDADADAYLIALDKRTGEVRWKTPRENHRGWSTPVLIHIDGKRELVLNGHTGVRGYDPETGRELWYCRGFNGRGTPTVTPAHGLLYVVNGLRGDVYAVRPGGRGNVTTTHMAWHTPRRTGRDLPSPIVIDRYLLVMDMRAGILTCYDALDGRELWKERVGGQHTASPVAWDGLAFFLNEEGVTTVVRPGPKLDIVARNTVGATESEIFRASITPHRGQVLIRSQNRLYCVDGEK